jgi:hypothetical protein
LEVVSKGMLDLGVELWSSLATFDNLVRIQLAAADLPQWEWRVVVLELDVDLRHKIAVNPSFPPGVDEQEVMLVAVVAAIAVVDVELAPYSAGQLPG